MRRLHKVLSAQYSKRYNCDVKIFRDERTGAWDVFLNGRYFTGYDRTINSRHLNEVLRFRKKIPEQLRLCEEASKAGRKHRRKKFMETQREKVFEKMEDLYDYGFAGKKNFTVCGKKT